MKNKNPTKNQQQQKLLNRGNTQLPHNKNHVHTFLYLFNGSYKATTYTGL